MTPDEIVAQLMRVEHRVPVEALRAAETHRAELTPRLLASLAEVVARPDILKEDPDLQLPFYAMYLLAAWRDPQAHPLLIGFLRLPGDQCVDLSGDIVTEDMNRILAQTAGGNPRDIVALARDPAVNEWVRNAAIGALSLLTLWGELPRTDLVAHYRDLIAVAGAPQNPSDPSFVSTEIVCCALDLRLREMRDELLALMDRGWIEEGVVGSREEVAAGFERPFAKPPESPIEDVAEAVRWWGCFERQSRPQRSRLPPTAPAVSAEPERSYEPRLPYRAPAKVGRNDPCPCGSGKKYKKCCGG